jgi:ribonucleotide reductase alpha subunit
MLFETGHPWITFKDACNIRSPQQHAGVVHSSNLCTEITLNTSDTETAVCNLGSVNLPRHIKDGAIDHDKLQRPCRRPCACSTTSSTSTTTPSRRRATPTCATARWAWG